MNDGWEPLRLVRTLNTHTPYSNGHSNSTCLTTINNEKIKQIEEQGTKEGWLNRKTCLHIYVMFCFKNIVSSPM